MARNKIDYNGNIYTAIPFIQTRKGLQCNPCNSCDIKDFGICDAAWCSSEDRSDHQNVVFKLIKEDEQ